MISGGNSNTICASYSKIGGGLCNSITSSAYKSAILGGWNNTISAGLSIINGGYKNIASANTSAVLSGKCNIASCFNATVISGYRSVASNNESLVGGGAYNKAMAFASAVIGGRVNTVCFNSIYGAIFGGNGNTICSGYRSVIISGNQNIINSDCSAILGGSFNKTCGFAKTTIIGSNICATQSCTTFVNCISAQNLVAGCGVQVGANGVLIPIPTTPVLNNIFIIGAGAGSTLRCGLSNQSNGACSAVLGGKFNCALGTYGIVAGGSSNTSNGINSIVGGGQSNQALCEHSFVGGGYCNISSNIHGSIGGGAYNRASGAYSSILGGCANDACNFSCVMIIGSNLCATQACTTFMNCASVENLTVGCVVCVGTNKVLQNYPFKPNFGLFAQTEDSIPVTATVVESSLIGIGVGGLTVPANGFSVGDSFNAVLDGLISNVGSATIIIRVKTLSGAILADTGIIPLDTATLKSWTLTLQFTIRELGTTGVASISSGGLFSYIKNAGTAFEGFVLTTLNTTTFDTTIDNTLVITAEWNTDSSSNSIFSRNFVLSKVY